MLQDYDLWYLQNSIEDLLSRRLIQKDSKRVSSRVPNMKDVFGNRRETFQERDDLRNARSSAPAGRDVAIDPDLSQFAFQPQCPPPIPVTPTAKPNSRARRANMGHSYHWQPSSLGSKLSSPLQQDGPYLRGTRHSIRSYESDDNDIQEVGSTGFEFPELLPLKSNFSPTMRNLKHPLYGTTVTRTGTTPLEDNICHEDTEISENSRLKGMIWPGMDLFDSASPEAKRKRNQRKDSSVLALMQTNAELVEPTEVIYFPSWELKQARFISGEVESSPLKEEDSPQPKRDRCRSIRAPLTELDQNTPHLGKKTRGRRPSQKKQKAHRSIVETRNSAIYIQDGSQSTSIRAKRPRKRTQQDDDDSDWSLTAARQSGKKRDKNKLKVFNDKPEATFASTLSNETEPNATANGQNLKKIHKEFRELNTECSALRDGGNIEQRVVPQSGCMLGPTSANLTKVQYFQQTKDRSVGGKENIEPIVDQNGRIDNSSSYGLGHSTQRYFSVRSDEPPRFYQSMPPFMDYDSAPSINGFRQMVNPLAINCSGQISDPDMPRPLHTPNLHPAAHYGIEEDRGMGAKAKFEESSGDETIDQGISGCLNFFDN